MAKKDRKQELVEDTASRNKQSECKCNPYIVCSFCYCTLCRDCNCSGVKIFRLFTDSQTQHLKLALVF